MDDREITELFLCIRESTPDAENGSFCRYPVSSSTNLDKNNPFSVHAVLTEQIFVGTRKTVKVISGIFPSRLPQYPAKICSLKPLGVRFSYA